MLVGAAAPAVAVLTAPTISIAAPPPGQPLHDLEPLITISYSGPIPPGLDLATLQVLVGGSDWSARFTKTTTSASHQVTPEERFTAGTLTIAASIRDTTGALASTSETYAVHPTLLGLSPAAGPAGTTLTVSGRGLDAVAEHNALLFPSAYGGTLRAPFATVDPVAGSGTAVVPVGARDGPVVLEVNARAGAAGIVFNVRSQYAECGAPIEMRAMADGSLLVLYGYYYAVVNGGYEEMADPECPRFTLGPVARRTVVRLFPDRCVALVADSWSVPAPPAVPLIVGIAVHKDGVGYAYARQIDSYRRHDVFWNPGTGTVRSEFSGNLVSSVGSDPGSPLLAMDFDAAGDLYFGGYDFIAAGTQGAPYSLWRITREALALGGNVALETVRAFDDILLGNVFSDAAIVLTHSDLRIDCDGSAHFLIATAKTGNFCSPCGYAALLRRTGMLPGMPVEDVVLQEPWALFANVYKIVPTCHPGELIGTVVKYGSASTGGTTRWLWRRASSGGGVATLTALDLGDRVARRPLELGANGDVWMGAEWGFPVVEGVVPVCGNGSQATARYWPCPSLAILPVSTRWKPQRSEAAIEVHFSSPYELSAATLQVRDANGAPVAATTSALVITGPLTYRLNWTGPWTRLDPGTGEQERLPAGHYKLVVRGTRADNGATLASAETIVSLVEVSEVRFEALRGAPALTPNPAVGTLPEQDPPQGRPGGGVRILAEARQPEPWAEVYDRVKVVAVITPAVAPDVLSLSDATTVRVHFRSFDADDPMPYLPDADGDVDAVVADNRGTPRDGTLADNFVDVAAGGTTASTELRVSHQPGDNYRVAASTAATWLQGLHAVQPSATGELSETGAGISPLLTVWRTLHLEIDSMPSAPLEADAPERNFITGQVVLIPLRVGGGLPTRIYVEPDASDPPLGLADGSGDLSNGGGAGRFQLGWLSGMQVQGNGTDFLDSDAGFEIPYTLTNAAGTASISGHVLGWDRATRKFTIDLPTRSGIFDGGTMDVWGLTWRVATSGLGNVDVVADVAWPFELVDDDSTDTPFYPTSLYLSCSDSAGCNIFAQAYIRPAWDLVGTVTPPFKRNVKNLNSDVAAQLAGGREWVSLPQFWVSYVQGAFQSDVLKDMDPNMEGSYFGQTVDVDDRHGSLLYVATLTDVQYCPRWDQMDHTFVHELGHQFGLFHGTGGVMNISLWPECDPVYDWFTAEHLAEIRAKGVQP